MEKLSDYLTITEAAAYLGVAPNTLAIGAAMVASLNDVTRSTFTVSTRVNSSTRS